MLIVRRLFLHKKTPEMPKGNPESFKQLTGESLYGIKNPLYSRLWRLHFRNAPQMVPQLTSNYHQIH